MTDECARRDPFPPGQQCWRFAQDSDDWIAWSPELNRFRLVVPGHALSLGKGLSMLWKNHSVDVHDLRAEDAATEPLSVVFEGEVDEIATTGVSVVHEPEEEAVLPCAHLSVYAHGASKAERRAISIDIADRLSHVAGQITREIPSGT